MSNVLGSIFPVRDIARKADAVGAKVLAMINTKLLVDTDDAAQIPWAKLMLAGPVFLPQVGFGG